REFLDAGFAAVVCCLDPRVVASELAGRAYDEELLAGLPQEVDPCGERGEFHTFVSAGPVLGRAVGYRLGEVVERDGFVFCDLLPA
ncbi:MAG TPA: hypothetical protein VD704_09145, partial [Gaiellaceae bacterium]|nr:hypothetical protein [Gaiellaceae bacterium]